MSSSEAGAEVDYSDEEEPKKVEEEVKLTPEKVVNEIVQPIPSEPLPPTPAPKLGKERREAIIQNFQQGQEDPEYSVKIRKDGKFVVTKRKPGAPPPSPARVEAPSEEEILARFRREFQEEMKQHKEYLTKKYKKIRDKQRAREFHPWPPDYSQYGIPNPVPYGDTRPYVKPVKPPGKYKRPVLDIRNF
jgi:hypothetical protein